MSVGRVLEFRDDLEDAMGVPSHWLTSILELSIPHLDNKAAAKSKSLAIELGLGPEELDSKVAPAVAGCQKHFPIL